MSRLDSAIRRLSAQRACLDLAARLVAELPGPAAEFGLGNGRTYDHLRGLLPGRRIVVFDRQIDAHPDCVPAEADLMLGDFRETAAVALDALGASLALVHADIGTGDTAASQALAAQLAPKLARLLAPGGVLATDQAMATADLIALKLPKGVRRGRYFLYRKRVDSITEDREEPAHDPKAAASHAHPAARRRPPAPAAARD